MRVLVIPDKFKGTLRADEAARAIAAGWRSVRAHDTLELLPMSDGGDGFGEIVGQLLAAEKHTASTVNAAHEPIEASWWWSEESRTAIVESANVIGLAMLPAGRFHPFELDTLGLGQLLQIIAKQHPGAKLIIGIGGSATNDGGFGMARGFGYRFLDLTECCLDRWVSLGRLLRIQVPQKSASFREVTIACDVQNPLLGPEGASRIYGPQKGLRTEDFPVAEKCLGRLADVVRTELKVDCSEEPGTGAAGGLGYGLRAFLNGQFEPGFNIFARLSHLSAKIARADLVITAEGSIDAQTEMGKGTGAIAQIAREQKKRCLGLAGQLAQKETRAFDFTLGIAPELTTVEEAKRSPAQWLQKLSALAATRVAALGVALLMLSFVGCKSPAEISVSSSPEVHAVQFLAQEVPAWSRDNGCFSCHNNGDGARALFVAAAEGYPVLDGIAETLAWLKAPEKWDDNKGDPGFSDQLLADIQFAAALLAGIDSGLIEDRALLDRAARRLLPHQAEDGAWQVEPQNPIGSPVTYGATLATYVAWKTLASSKDPTLAPARENAARWLANAAFENITAAAALLLFATEVGDSEKQRTSTAYLARHQLPAGGWGPYPLAPAENFDTALAILALSQAKAVPELRQRARAFLLSQQNADGSWPATTRPTGGESYAQQISTTAWATIAALASQ